ncbi:anti-sigma factor family protein [Kaarinaea lacus]
MIIVSDQLSTESFHAFIDEQLSEEQYAQVEAQLDEIPEKIEEIQQCQIINERLREVFDPIVEEEVPDDLYELALYGILSENQDDTEDFQQFGYEYDESSNTIAGFNDEIVSPLDSFDAALELQDEDFIDDDEFADIEALSAAGEKDLANFDIDNMRNDSGNILPDIFDQEYNPAPTAASRPTRTSEDLSMLDDIGSLSLEPLEKGEQSATAVTEASFPQQSLFDDAEPKQSIDAKDENVTPDFELESIEQTEESLSFDVTEQNEETTIPVEQPTKRDVARRRVLETLEAREELSLEPLEGEQDENAIQLPELGEPVEMYGANLVDTAIDTTNEAVEVPGAAIDQSDNEEVATNDSFDYEDYEPETNLEQGGSFAGPAIPTESDLDQSPDVVLNESQAGTKVSQAKPVAGVADTSEFPIDEIVEQLDEIPEGNDETPQDVVAEFFAENRAEPDFEVSEVVKQFEEVSDEFDHLHDQEPFDSPVAHIKQKADEVFTNFNTKFSAIKNTFIRKEQEPFPDFNKAPVSFQVKKPQATIEESAKSTPFDFDIGIDEEPKSEGLSRKIGDTLKFYKQKLSKEKAYEDTGPIGTHIVPHVEPASGFEKYKQIATHTLERVSPENRMTIGGAILLVIGLLVGGSVVSLVEQPANMISVDKVEQLAIDAHILYTQQNQNFAGNPSTSITESMQWLSARIGRQIRLADVQLEDFKHQRAIVMPTMVSYATANIFENKSNQSITLFISGNVEPVANSPLVCRVPSGVDGLCSWVKDSVQYIAVANLSLSRVRAFSQALVDNL